jgi:hypothetical protein
MAMKVLRYVVCAVAHSEHQHILVAPGRAILKALRVHHPTLEVLQPGQIGDLWRTDDAVGEDQVARMQDALGVVQTAAASQG